MLDTTFVFYLRDSLSGYEAVGIKSLPTNPKYYLIAVFSFTIKFLMSWCFPSNVSRASTSVLRLFFVVYVLRFHYRDLAFLSVSLVNTRTPLNLMFHILFLSRISHCAFKWTLPSLFVCSFRLQSLCS